MKAIAIVLLIVVLLGAACDPPDPLDSGRCPPGTHAELVKVRSMFDEGEYWVPRCVKD